jgi:hypothetical protein
MRKAFSRKGAKEAARRAEFLLRLSLRLCVFA